MIIKPKIIEYPLYTDELEVNGHYICYATIKEFLFVRNGYDVYLGRRKGIDRYCIIAFNPTADVGPTFESPTLDFIQANLSNYNDPVWLSILEGYHYVTSHPELLT